MKDKILIISILIISLNSFAQSLFEKGYYINNVNERVECLIKNIDWKDNPSNFQYKLSKNTEVQLLTINSVSEFGIYDKSKFIRSNVNIDISQRSNSDLSNNKNPVFKERRIFLRVLVEGKASLYAYGEGNITRYFFKKDDSEIEQLIYKRYKETEFKIAENNRFRQQLWTNFKCQNMALKKIQNIQYKRQQLVSFFINQNKCNDSKIKNFEKNKTNNPVNIILRPGINNSSLTIENKSSILEKIDFDSKVSFRLGLEIELMLPYNRNKWSIIFEPTYQYYNSEKRFQSGEITVDYKSIELPLGFRHYFILNDNSRLFANGSFILDFNQNSTINFSREIPVSLDAIKLDSKSNVAFGIGYKYQNKLSLELRYLTNREVLNGFQNWRSDYKTLSLIFGYQLF